MRPDPRQVQIDASLHPRHQLSIASAYVAIAPASRYSSPPDAWLRLHAAISSLLLPAHLRKVRW